MFRCHYDGIRSFYAVFITQLMKYYLIITLHNLLMHNELRLTPQRFIQLCKFRLLFNRQQNPSSIYPVLFHSWIMNFIYIWPGTQYTILEFHSFLLRSPFIHSTLELLPLGRSRCSAAMEPPHETIMNWPFPWPFLYFIQLRLLQFLFR